MKKMIKNCMLLGIVLIMFLALSNNFSLINTSNNEILAEHYGQSFVSSFSEDDISGSIITGMIMGVLLLIVVIFDRTKFKILSITLYTLLIIAVCMQFVALYFVLFFISVPLSAIGYAIYGKDPKLEEEKEKQKRLKLFDEKIKHNSIYFNNVYDTYRAIQLAYANYNYDMLKDLLDDELYKTRYEELKSQENRGLKNIKKDFEFVSGKVFDVVDTEEYLSVNLKLKFKSLDYVVDSENNVISGNNITNIEHSYMVTFIYDKKEKTNCKNCGASMNFDDIKCNYCNNEILSINGKMRLLCERKII